MKTVVYTRTEMSLDSHTAFITRKNRESETGAFAVVVIILSFHTNVINEQTYSILMNSIVASVNSVL